MKKMNQFGESTEGYKIRVLNEREIRAAAGIMFVFMFISVMFALLKFDFQFLKFSITFFLIDISIRVFISPYYSPSLITGRFIVRNQSPEYVGAEQKKFAWIFGVILSSAAFVLIVILNSYSPVSGIICMICLMFLFFEASFGICLGCIFYKLIYKEKAQYCPGEICDRKSRAEIQKVSIRQILSLAGFITLIVFSVIIFRDQFKVKPRNLFSQNENFTKSYSVCKKQ